MFRDRLRSGFAHVGQALREPEVFALRWQRGETRYSWPVWAALIFTSILGTTAYGMTLRLLGWLDRILAAAFHLTLAALVTTGWGGLALTWTTDLTAIEKSCAAGHAAR